MVSELEKTIQVQDRFMCTLWEESHGQFSAVHKMWKLGSWQICKNKKVTARLPMHFVCSKYKEIMEGKVDLIKKLSCAMKWRQWKDFDISETD